jgi:hypothetical protein
MFFCWLVVRKADVTLLKLYRNQYFVECVHFCETIVLYSVLTNLLFFSSRPAGDPSLLAFLFLTDLRRKEFHDVDLPEKRLTCRY